MRLRSAPGARSNHGTVSIPEHSAMHAERLSRSAERERWMMDCVGLSTGVARNQALGDGGHCAPDPLHTLAISTSKLKGVALPTAKRLRVC